MWFHTYDGNIRAFRPELGQFTGLLRDQVQSIRGWFVTEKISVPRPTGTNSTTVSIPPEVSKDYREYKLNDHRVFVNLAHFTWYEFRYVSKYRYWTPVFRLRIKIADANRSGEEVQVVKDGPNGRTFETTKVKVFFNHSVVMEFPPEYSNRPPSFQIDDPKYLSLPQSHEHHMRYGDSDKREGTVLCIMAEARDWKPGGESTSVSAINAALLWMVYHFDKFGENWGSRPEWSTSLWDR